MVRLSGIGIGRHAARIHIVIETYFRIISRDNDPYYRTAMYKKKIYIHFIMNYDIIQSSCNNRIVYYTRLRRKNIIHTLTCLVMALRTHKRMSVPTWNIDIMTIRQQTE